MTECWVNTGNLWLAVPEPLTTDDTPIGAHVVQ